MGKLKGFVATTLAVGALTVGMSITPTDASAKTLRYAEFGPDRGTRAAALNWFADEIKARSNGALEIEFHWGKALLGTKVAAKGIGDGVADMGSILGFFTPKELRAYNIGDLPVDNADEWVGMRALYDLAMTNPALKDEFSRANLTYVTNYTTGPIQLICTQPINGIDDLKGLKTRASGPYGKALTDLGAEVQSMGQPKVYQALDSGLVTCNQNYYYSMRAYKQYEVAGSVVELDWGQNMSFGIVMNQDSYNDLSDAEKAVINSVGSDFIDHLAKLMIEGRVKDKAEMEQGIDGKSITVTRFSDADRAAVQAAGSKYVAAWVADATADGLDGAGILADYEGLIGKYAATRASSGYPWK